MVGKKKFIVPLVCAVIILAVGCSYYFYSRSVGKTKQDNMVKKNVAEKKKDIQSKKSSNNNEGLKKDNAIVIKSEETPINKDKIQKIHAQFKDGICWIQSAIDENGIILGATQFDINNVQKLLLYDIENKKSEFLYNTEPKWSIGQAKINSSYIIWEETIPQDSEFTPTRVKFMDRKNRKVTKLYENMKYGMYDSFIDLCLSDKAAYWSMTYHENDKANLCIMKYDPATDKITKFKDTATEPDTNGKDFYYIAPESVASQRDTIFKENLSTGSQNKIETEIQPAKISVSGNDFVFSGIINDDTAKVSSKSLYFNKNNKVYEIYSSNKEDAFDFPEFNGKFIGWGGTDKLRLFSVDNNKTYILTDKFANYTDVKMSKNYAIWNGPVIEDENEAQKDAVKRGMYDSYIYILDLNDVK